MFWGFAAEAGKEEITLTAKREKKKLLKENALLDAAFDLFTKLGVDNTTIDKIVQHAGVAKGTFYLYFRDKYDIRDMIIVRKTSALLRDAIMEARSHQFSDRIDAVICFADYLITYLSKDRLLTRLIHKNLSFSLYKKVLNDPLNGTEWRNLLNEFTHNVDCSGYGREESPHLLFILLEMTGSVCYSSIIYREPAPIDEMKPILLKTIRKILQ